MTAYRYVRTACGCGPYLRTPGCQSNHVELPGRFSFHHTCPQQEPEHDERPFIPDIHFCAMTEPSTLDALDTPDGEPAEGWSWLVLDLEWPVVCESGQVWYSKASILRELLR